MLISLFRFNILSNCKKIDKMSILCLHPIISEHRRTDDLTIVLASICGVIVLIIIAFILLLVGESHMVHTSMSCSYLVREIYLFVNF